MGTSTSSVGPGSNSPLVPSWADTDGQGPGPEPVPQRFQTFRTSLGKFVASGDQDYLRAALGSYAKTATGGSAVAPRRFGSMVRSGGALFDTLSALRQGISTPELDLASLNNQDTDIAIDAIVQALVPADGDADRVREAMTEALSECLEGYDDFDFAHITDEMLVQVLLAYVRRVIFGQVVLDSSKAFEKAGAGRVQEAEKELRALIDAATDKHMRPLLSGDLKAFGAADIEKAQLAAIREIWVEWEGYVP